MGIGSVFDLGAGIFKRFFSKEAKQENRANEIEYLQREQKELSKNNVNGIHNKRLDYIASRLRICEQEAKNTR
jgi:hypothetical protein